MKNEKLSKTFTVLNKEHDISDKGEDIQSIALDAGEIYTIRLSGSMGDTALHLGQDTFCYGSIPEAANALTRILTNWQTLKTSVAIDLIRKQRVIPGELFRVSVKIGRLHVYTVQCAWTKDGNYEFYTYYKGKWTVDGSRVEAAEMSAVTAIDDLVHYIKRIIFTNLLVETA